MRAVHLHPKPARPFRPHPRVLSAEIPFELRNHLIVVQARLNSGQPVSLLLNNAEPFTLLGSIFSDSAHLPKRGGRWKSRTETGWEQRWWLRDISFDLSGLNFKPPSVSTANLPVFYPPIDGVLGADLFKHFIVEVDFTAKKLRLYDPEHYQYSKGGLELPIKLQKGLPWVQATVSLSNQPPRIGSFALNLNNPSTLGLSTRFADGKLGQASAALNSTNPPQSKINSKVRHSRLPELNFGSQTFTNLNVTIFSSLPQYPKNASGMIGFRVLRCFDLVLDYPHQRLFVQTNAFFLQANQEGFPWQWRRPLIYFHNSEINLNLCGAILIANGSPLGPFRITHVHSESAAERAGLHAGDVLLALDDQPISSHSLESLMQLTGLEGKLCRLKLQRGEQQITVTLNVNWMMED